MHENIISHYITPCHC